LAFALGVFAATMIGPVGGLRGVSETASPAPGLPARFAPMAKVYPAEVIRVLDGDTFEARVRVWPGLDITTKIRLRGIDAPEMHARCPEERTMAEAARDALSALLAPGGVGVSHVSLGKYAGRVIADASAYNTANISEALFAAGHARRYDGGRRQSWCTGRSF
jgi:endonuclease YncB( thermonuclease family)